MAFARNEQIEVFISLHECNAATPPPPTAMDIACRKRWGSIRGNAMGSLIIRLTQPSGELREREWGTFATRHSIAKEAPRALDGPYWAILMFR